MQLDSMVQGIKRTDLTEFVKLKISEYSEIFLKVRINNFTVDDLSQQMNWSPEVAARVIFGLMECDLVAKDKIHEGLAKYVRKDRLDNFKNDRLHEFISNPNTIDQDLDPIVGEIEFFCVKHGDASRWYEQDKSSYEGVEKQIALCFYKYVVQNFLTVDNLNKALLRGSSIADLVFNLPHPRHFDHYEELHQIMKLHALSFAMSYPVNNSPLGSYLSQYSPEKVLDAGGGLGQALLFNLLYFQPGSQLHVLDHPSSQRPLDSLRRLFFGNHFGQINWNFADFSNEEQIGSLDKTSFNAIILGWILHDWEDDVATGIIKNLQSLIAPGGQFVVLEKPLDKFRVKGACYDLMMMALSGGKERTYTGYDQLFSEIGFRRVDTSHQQGGGRSTLVYQKT